jgi:hypothetical protein
MRKLSITLGMQIARELQYKIELLLQDLQETKAWMKEQMDLAKVDVFLPVLYLTKYRLNTYEF